jgi:nicotinate-nucleotide pyrophosphorylase (carboxylating)
MGLYDAILIKENHAALAGGIGAAVRKAREASGGPAVEVECRDLSDVREALEAGAERLLLDNFELEGLRAAVAERDTTDGTVPLEASGGITLETVAEVAATGVEFISVGALTHSAPALDLSMLLEPLPAE